jgi:hypothetical protein
MAPVALGLAARPDARTTHQQQQITVRLDCYCCCMPLFYKKEKVKVCCCASHVKSSDHTDGFAR